MRLSKTRAASILAAALLAGGAALGAGCTRSIVATPANTGYDPANVADEMDYWLILPDRPYIANDEALHGLFILAEGGDPNRTYEARVEDAKARGWLPGNWDEPAATAAQRGMVARAVVRILEIRGGVMMHLTGGNSRYALRELIAMGIIAPSSGNQTISGADFIGVISKAGDYMKQRAAENANTRPLAEPGGSPLAEPRPGEGGEEPADPDEPGRIDKPGGTSPGRHADPV